MLNKIIIRTNYSSQVGLGHFYRMIRFLKPISKKFDLILLIDEKKNLPKLDINCKILEIYGKKNKFKSEIDDAIKINKLIEGNNVKFIIVDDYRIGKKWEKFFYKKYKLIIFDDLNNKKHLCDFIVDSKHVGEETQNRYNNLLPNNCIKLLGPRYAVINDQLNQKKKTKNNLLLYFGGGGNLSHYFNFFKNIVEENKTKKNLSKINITLVIGPVAEGYSKFLKYNKHKNVKILQNNYNLKTTLENTSMFLGVSSSIIYDLNYLKIPSCIFSTDDNQDNSMDNLEDMGNYFSIDHDDIKHNYKKLSKLVFILFENYRRISKLTNSCKIKIDNKGHKRIWAIIINKKKITELNKNKIKLVKNGYYKIKDSLINKYLFFRNQNINRKMSINRNKIKNLDHYIWWFTTKRKSFYFIKNFKLMLIFSQEIINIINKKFWYGAWFKCQNEIKISDIIEGLNMQIIKTKKINSLKWFAIIKKNNSSVYYANKLIGFLEDKLYINKISKYLKVYFKIKKISNYHFLIK